MIVVHQDGKMISDCVFITISPTNPCRIIGRILSAKENTNVGEYDTEKEAIDVIHKFSISLKQGKNIFYMPQKGSDKSTEQLAIIKHMFETYNLHINDRFYKKYKLDNLGKPWAIMYHFDENLNLVDDYGFVYNDCLNDFIGEDIILVPCDRYIPKEEKQEE